MSAPTTKTVYLLKAGDAIGLYRVVRPLGAGGMGEVYLVEHQHLRKRYALKILPAETAADADFIDRFRIEARVMADLEHPGIVRVHNFGEEDGRYYLVMDYVCGRDGGSRSLDDETAWGKKLPEAVALDVALQLCDALYYAHSFPAGAVIHRDLKPGNILIHQPPSAVDGASAAAGPTDVSVDGAPAAAVSAPELRVKIADFGLARIVGVDYVKSVIDRSTRLTVMAAQPPVPADAAATQINAGGSTVSLLGTYDYMSPEQKTGATVDARSDLYSLGLIIYRTLTGHKPEGSYDPPSKYGVDPRWDPILERCLRREPAERYASAKAIQEALLVLKQPARPRWIPAAIGAAALLLVLGGVALLRGARGPHGPAVAPSPEDVAEPGVTLRFALEARPAGATLAVTREGAPVAELTLPERGTRLDLRPGLYRFRLSAPGYRTLEQDVVVAEDQPKQWTAQLQAAVGRLEVEGSTADHLRIMDRAGQRITVTPDTRAGLLVYALTPGEYEVMSVRPDHTPASRKIELADQQTVRWKVETSPLLGALWIESELPADIWSGNKMIGRTGEWLRSFPLGKHALQLRRQGYRSADLALDMPPNGEIRLTAPAWVAQNARLTVRADVVGREVPPEHRPAAGQLKIGAQEAVPVTLPWTGAVTELGRSLTVELLVEGYQPPRPENVSLRDGDDRALAFRLIPKPARVRIRSNVPAGIYRLRSGPFTTGGRRSLFARETPIGKTGEPIELEPFVTHQLTVYAEKHEPVTVDIHPVLPGGNHDVVNVALKPDAEPPAP